LARGLPDVAALPWRIEPHAFDAQGLRPVAPRLDLPLAVVAVGHLNHAKGAGLLGALARRAEERRLPLRFAVVGTVEGGAVPPSVRVTGAFPRERLCEWLEAEGTGIALLPSICPETYSYVTDELMATGLPLAVLDLGAPAERVAGYHSGLLLPTEGLDAQLDALVAFGRRLGAPT
jgi:glycosyltransferase involved in cell wall biosynthesis